MINTAFEWLVQHYIELIATIISLIYIFLSIKENTWLWLFGLVGSAMYVWVFFENKLYADMGINMYYVIISIYGWLNWTVFKKGNSEKHKPISRLTRVQIILTFVFTILLTIIIGYYLDNYTDSDVPYPDAFTTGASIIATMYLARKILEQWIMWVIIDFVSLILYIYKGLYPTVILFAIYTIMAVVGFKEWRKVYNEQ